MGRDSRLHGITNIVLQMAKKTVATLQTSSKRLTKAIKMVKSPKSGAYIFVESVMAPEMVNEWLSKH